MRESMIEAKFRNLLIRGGAYYLSWWVANHWHLAIRTSKDAFVR